jgi:tetratricopeptide (TPR) repeat protein
MVGERAQAQAAASTERPASNAPSSSDDVARGLFQAGSAAYGAGHFEDALGYFQRAYELSQRPGFLYNIGQAADRLHRDELTVAVFRRYLELVPNSEHRTEVESRLRALERLVALNAEVQRDRKSTRLNSSHNPASRMPSSA